MKAGDIGTLVDLNEYPKYNGRMCEIIQHIPKNCRLCGENGVEGFAEIEGWLVVLIGNSEHSLAVGKPNVVPIEDPDRYKYVSEVTLNRLRRVLEKGRRL